MQSDEAMLKIDFAAAITTEQMQHLDEVAEQTRPNRRIMLSVLASSREDLTEDPNMLETLREIHATVHRLKKRLEAQIEFSDIALRRLDIAIADLEQNNPTPEDPQTH